jgi:hypothetical protein
MEGRQPVDEIIKGLTTKADKIRALVHANYDRAESAGLSGSVTSKCVMCCFARGSRAVYAGKSRTRDGRSRSQVLLCRVVRSPDQRGLPSAGRMDERPGKCPAARSQGPRVPCV